jgi:TolB-like protein/DNA-binding winged helix-turn-helix (wHTH) protein/Tfp pilus assembly protein PilF
MARGVGLQNARKKFAKILQIAFESLKDRILNPPAGPCASPELGVGPQRKWEKRGVLATAGIFLFEEFRLDRQGDGLSRRDERGMFVPVPIGLRALDVLVVLVERPRELVSKEAIMGAVWGRTVVENANLTVQISALRRVLDQGRSESSCIQTVPARGYRFLPAVTRIGHAARPSIAGNNTVAALPAVGVIRSAQRRDRTRLARIGAAVSAALVIASVAWWVWPAPRSPATGMPTAASAQHPSAPRLSIVVLPFANLSNNPDQQYFTDGITEDLTADLSRLPNMLVISRNTAFTLRNKPVNAKEIGRELNVRYLLEGSVQRPGKRFRIDAQLIDAEADSHLWAERFDRDVSDLFALQNDITGQIAVALNLKLVATEAARPTSNPDSLEYILRGRAAGSKGPPTRESKAESIDFFERALTAEPGSIDAQSRLANGLIGRVLDGLSDSPAEDIRRAQALLEPALATSPRNPFLHYVKGQILRAVAQGPFGLDAEAREAHFADAISEYETVLAANPNAVNVLAHLAWCEFETGSPDEAIPLLERSIRLSPRDPKVYLRYFRLGAVYLFEGRLDDALLWLERARRANPPFPPAHSVLAAAYGLKGDLVRAKAELAEFNETEKGRHDNRFATIALVRKNADLNTPMLHDRFEEFLITGLRKAGLPEE